MKICGRCNIEQELECFSKKASTKDGLQYTCKVCMKEIHRNHYVNNTDKCKQKARKSNSQYRLRNLQYVIDFLKLNPCVDCGEKDPIVLEFDHFRDKEYCVSQMHTYAFDKLKEEIEKCEVRCRNCHKRKTAIQLNYYKGIVF